jgi:hypothetical protein
LRDLPFSDHDRIKAVLPFLEKMDTESVEDPAIAGILEPVDKHGSGTPDFSVYLPYLKSADEETRNGLVNYMRRVAPETAEKFLDAHL